jgi:hypothetical protein
VSVVSEEGRGSTFTMVLPREVSALNNDLVDEQVGERRVSV